MHGMIEIRDSNMYWASEIALQKHTRVMLPFRS